MNDANSHKSSGLSSSFGQMREDLSDDASRLAGAATEQVEQTMEGGKHKAMSAAQSAASAIEKTANSLREDDQAPDWLPTALEKTAKQITQLADKFDGKQVSEIRHEVVDFARENPGAFLGVAAAAGFIAARFLRAGGEYQAHNNGGSNHSNEASRPSVAGTGMGVTDASAYASAYGASGQQAPSVSQRPQGEQP